MRTRFLFPSALATLFLITLISFPTDPAHACLRARVPTPEQWNALQQQSKGARTAFAEDPDDPRHIEALLKAEARRSEWIQPRRQAIDPKSLPYPRERLHSLAETWRQMEPENLDAHRAVVHFQSEATEREATLRAFVRDYPERGDGVGELAVFLHRADKQQEAKALVDDFLAFHEDDPEAYVAALRLADAAHDENGEKIAFALMERFPDHVMALVLRFADLARHDSSPEEVLAEAAERLLAREADLDENILGKVCRGLLEREMAEPAATCLRQLLQREEIPGDLAWARERLVRILVQQGDVLGAETLFFGERLPIEAEPRQRLRFALWLVEAGDCPGALALASTLERGLFQETSQLLQDCGRPLQAADDLATYLRELPLERWEWRQIHHLVPVELLRTARVESLLRQRLEADPTSNLAHSLLHSLLERLGDQQRTLAHLKLWLEQVPDSVAAELAQELQKL